MYLSEGTAVLRSVSQIPQRYIVALSLRYIVRLSLRYIVNGALHRRGAEKQIIDAAHIDAHS